MKTYLIFPVILITVLAGCTQLAPEDRAMISSANQAALDAKQQAIMAADDARAARDDANRAANAAQAASDKADRIFRQGQNK